MNPSPRQLPWRLLLATVVLGWLPVQAVEIVAHRGASHDAPENTLAATRLAWEQGADAVETDIFLTRDGRIIVAHDPNVKRTTGRNALIADLTFEELRKLDAGRWKGAAFAGERLPALDEQLALLPPGKRMLVESKVGPEIVPELKRTLERHRAGPDCVTIISFNYDTLVEVTRQLPGYKTLWLVSYREPGAAQAPDARPTPSLDELIRKATAAGLTGLDLRHNWPLDAAAVGRIRGAGLELHVWTVNEVEIARRWIGLGVDSITTDRPGWLREQLGLTAEPLRP